MPLYPFLNLDRRNTLPLTRSDRVPVKLFTLYTLPAVVNTAGLRTQAIQLPRPEKLRERPSKVLERLHLGPQAPRGTGLGATWSFRATWQGVAGQYLELRVFKPAFTHGYPSTSLIVPVLRYAERSVLGPRRRRLWRRSAGEARLQGATRLLPAQRARC